MPLASKRASSAETLVPLRITVVRPLPGVTLKLQRGAQDCVPPSLRSPDSVSFDFELRLKDEGGGAGALRWLGEHAQGSPADRFVYVNVGRRAGQTDTAWDRRAKVKLAGITRAQVQLPVEPSQRRVLAGQLATRSIRSGFGCQRIAVSGYLDPGCG